MSYIFLERQKKSFVGFHVVLLFNCHLLPPSPLKKKEIVIQMTSDCEILKYGPCTAVILCACWVKSHHLGRGEATPPLHKGRALPQYAEPVSAGP